ncbi:MAG TPA: carboxypeptidase regulatory-like domain-containing protein [Pyrinomonadaceae bacterium]|jgi:hypothetical protein
MKNGKVQTTVTRNSAVKFLFKNRRGRLAGFLILAIAVTAIAATTLSLAQSKKPASNTQAAKRIPLPPRPVVPGRYTSEREREEREGLSKRRARYGQEGQEGQTVQAPTKYVDASTRKPVNLKPKEVRLTRAKSFNGDLRELPYIPSPKRERPEREMPSINPGVLTRGGVPPEAVQTTEAPQTSVPTLSAPAPAPLSTFEGLDNANWGAGHPPDTVGDVGPNHYIQAINTSIGIYNKSTGARVAAFTYDTFMSQGNFGNVCDTDNFGDPTVLYDTFEDRWIISDFAFQQDGAGNVSPQVALQCIAVSKTGDPISGGWNFYSINTTGGLGDYPKMGVWPDGIYMSVNMFDYAAAGSFQNPRVYAFNKAQMYAGAPSVQSVQFDAPSTEFSLLPANARLQAGTPPAGSPNYLTVVAQYLNVISVYKFKVDWGNISTSTFTGPFDSLNTTWWAQLAAADQTAPTPANRNDELYARLMMQNQYTNMGGVESLWNSMTAGLGNPTTNITATQSAVRYYQLKVTGGTVEPTTSQAFTYSPADTIWRYMPSLAIDRSGNMAIGFTTSNATTHPTLSYAGRLSTDPANSLPQTDQLLFAGTGSQSGNCGGAICNRWGDYSAMSLDPDGCTFWYTNEYYATTGLNHQTRIGYFKFSQCTPVGNGGTVSGTVTATPGGAPLQGATVMLGSRSTTTDASGNYSFTNIPAGTYPGMTASYPGRTTASASSIVVTDSNTTTQNFSLSVAATSGCFVDTSQADFQAGIPTNTDVASSAGNVILATALGVDAQSTTETQAFGFSNTAWFGQTFTPTVTGQATQVALDLFCSTCTGTPPNVVIAIRNASGNLPTGADIASASIPFSNSGAGGFYTATFSSPPTLTAGTQYAIVVRMAAAYATGTPAYVTSTTSAYAGGRRTTSNNSGSTWAGTTPDTSFKVTMKTGFKSSGDFVSSLKDANPAAGLTAQWGTFSWTATTPASTTLKFQAAASNSPYGPFNYVGPDGTASTFFSSGGSLSQFNGIRFLRYKALFTGIPASSPTLADVTICFNDVASTVAVSGQVKDGANNALSGVLMTLSGSQSGTTTTDGSGNYSFTGLPYGGNYTVTPSKQNYAFFPQNRVYNNLTSNQTNANFTGRVVRKPADFDGDSKTDVSRWNPATGDWNISQSLSNTLSTHLNWGSAALGDKLVPGDYDGDTKTDIAVFRPSDGNWYIIKSTDGSVLVKNWGGAGDVPVPGDYDGDGITDVAVFRLSEGNWYVLNSSTNTMTVRGWGDSNDKLVPGDYDGDGKTDIAVFRPSDGNWYIINSSTNATTVQGWGTATDSPVQGDYDGDGKTDIAVFRPSEGNWYIVNSSGGTTVRGWGDANDQPVPGDYDGDGKTDIAVYRPSDSNWYIIQSTTNTLSLINFGSNSEVPLPAAYIKTLP